jgi:hypothetical protein
MNQTSVVETEKMRETDNKQERRKERKEIEKKD